MRTYDEFKASNIRSKVYNALAEISFEEDASKEEMENALDFFRIKFYEIYGDEPEEE